MAGTAGLQRSVRRGVLGSLRATASGRGPPDAGDDEHAADELHAASRRGEWDQMARLITDDMMQAFATFCAPDGLRPALEERFGEIATRACVTLV